MSDNINNNITWVAIAVAIAIRSLWITRIYIPLKGRMRV